MSDAAKDYLRWILRVEGAPHVQVSEIGLKTVINAGLASFTLAMEKRFEDDATEEEIRQFVARVRGTWIQPEALNPVLAERILLDGLGEEDLVDDVPLAEVSRAQNLLSYAMVNDLGITGDALEQFVEEAVKMLTDLENEPENGDDD